VATHTCVCGLQQPLLHTLPVQQLSPTLPQFVVPPLPLPLDVEVLQELADVPETDAVCPLSVHVIVQLDPLPPTEHVAPLADSLPHRQMGCPPAFALQHAGGLPDPEHPPTTAIPRTTAAKQATHPRISFKVTSWTARLGSSFMQRGV
jgi:hypothetical protein